MIAVKSHGDRFREALGFVVDRAWANGIHVAPVRFFLRMLQRIAVALRRGRDEILRTVLERDLEGMESSQRTDFQRGNAVNRVIHRAGGTGEVEDEIDRADVEGLADIFIYKIKSGVISEMVKVRTPPGEQVVDDNHTPALAEQSVAQMRSQKTGATRDQSAFLAHAFFAVFFIAALTPSGTAAARPTL